jgi:hypothetical protein
MAGRGPAPKAQRIRPRDTVRRQSEFTTIRADGVLRGPDLPEVMDWPEQTREFWNELRLDAAAPTWTPVEWLNLRDVCLLHADLWSGNPKVAAEIRLRLSAYGIGPDARLRLRLLVDTGEDEPESTLDRLQREQAEKAAKSRRRRILAAVEADNRTTNPQGTT